MAAAAARVDAPGGGRVTGTRRIRVLHVITSLTVGGAERLVVSAATRLAPDRYEHAICCLAERGPLAGDAEAAGVPVYTVGAFPGVTNPFAFARLVRIVRRFAPTIVHTHLQSANLYGRTAARLARVPVVIATEHNVYAQKPQRYIAIERWLAGSTDVLIAVSKAVADCLGRQLGVPASRLRIVYNGIAPKPPSASRVAAFRRYAGGGQAVVATVASLTQKKGHEFLLRAIARVRDRGVGCTLLLAGDGPARASLESLARELGIGATVHFLGAIDGVADVLAAADVFVLPSLVEGLPLALLEAMAAGKPVIATTVGGVPEVVAPDSTGVLVPPADVEALAAALSRLLSSPELRQRLGEGARSAVATRFTETAYLSSLDAIYTEAARRAAA